jgi:protein-S-isoprenylcysteine O-methyltransferase Ste14
MVINGAINLIISDGFDILLMLAFSTGHWAPNSSFKIPSVSCCFLFSSGDSFTIGLEVRLFLSHCARAQLTIATEEEKSLINFFGDDYVQYRRRVKTRIPFIP